MRIYKNTTHYFEIAILDENGDFVTSFPASAGDIEYYIINSVDGNIIDSGTMSSSGNVWIANYDFNDTGVYRIEYITPSEYENIIEQLIVDEYNNFKADVSTIESEVKRVLGLVHENFYIDLPTYDSDNNMTSARVRIYSDSVSVGGEDNIIGEYMIAVNPSGAGKFTTWKMTRE